MFSKGERKGTNNPGKERILLFFNLDIHILEMTKFLYHKNPFNLLFLKHYITQLTHFGESLPTSPSPLATPTSMPCVTIFLGLCQKLTRFNYINL